MLSNSLQLPTTVNHAIHHAFIGLEACFFALGVVLLILPSTIRHNLTAFKERTFPIYPEGRPSSGSTSAHYFPTHLATSDNTAQIALGCVAALYGGISTAFIYLQCVRPRPETRTPRQRMVGCVATLAAGALSTLVGAITTGLSFGSNDEGRAVDLRSVGYWPWQNMFPTIQWSIEIWTCKVRDQLALTGTRSAKDFAGMCKYAKISKWLSVLLMVLGLAAVTLSVSGLLEQKDLDHRENAELRVDALRDCEKSGKEP